MVTIAQLRDQVARRLLGTTNEAINLLSADITNADTTVPISFDTPGANVGTIIEIDSELMHIMARAGTNLTVVRGWRGSASIGHSSGSVIHASPRFPMITLLELIGEELLSWPHTFGQLTVVEREVPADTLAVDLGITAGLTVRRLLRSRLHPRAGSGPGASYQNIDIQLISDPDKNQFASGYGLQLADTFGETRTIQVECLTDFDLSALSTLTTDLATDVGMSPNLVDALIYGVMWRAVSTLEVQRTSDAAMESARAEQSPPTHRLQTATALKTIRDERLGEEQVRLYDKYPVLRTQLGS